VLSRDNSVGPFIDEWKKVYGDISKDVEEVDIASALSAAALAVKDENELVLPLPIYLCPRLIYDLARDAKCIQGVHCPHESLFCRRDVKYT
jgi:hypothetical protein